MILLRDLSRPWRKKSTNIWLQYQKMYIPVRLNSWQINKKHHTAIKMTTTNVKMNSYIDYNVDCNQKFSKFEVGDRVWISKYKNIFAKYSSPNWSEKVFVIEKCEKFFTVKICYQWSRQSRNYCNIIWKWVREDKLNRIYDRKQKKR